MIGFGERICLPGETIDYVGVTGGMDPIDRGEIGLPKGYKQAVSYTPYPRPDYKRWEGKGFPDRIVAYMRDGVVIDPFEAGVTEAARGSLRGSPYAASAAREGADRVPGCFFDEHGEEHRFQIEDGQYNFPDRRQFL